MAHGRIYVLTEKENEKVSMNFDDLKDVIEFDDIREIAESLRIKELEELSIMEGAMQFVLNGQGGCMLQVSGNATDLSGEDDFFYIAQDDEVIAYENLPEMYPQTTFYVQQVYSFHI